MARPKRGDVIDVSIESVDEKGMGVGHLNGYTVRVRGGVPGDKLRGYVRRVRNRQREVQMQKTEVLDEEISRVKPRCSHFGVCGGCVWQDVPYDQQIGLKTALVKHCLDGVGIDLELDDPVVMADPFFYRNKMEYSFGTSRDGEMEIGLHIPGRFDRVFDLEACYLQSERSNNIVAFVRDFLKARDLSVYHLKSHTGLLRFLTIREGKNTNESMVILTTSGEDFTDAQVLSDALVQRFPEVKCVIHSINRKKAQVAFGDEEISCAERPFIYEKLDGYTFEISPTSFFQTNTIQAEKLYRRIGELAEPKETDRVLDLYCGMGGISFYLAEKASQVLGIEVSEPAIRDAQENCIRNNITNCTFVAGQAEDILRQMDPQTGQVDLVVTDPPRMGMHPKALQALIGFGPPRIVYVSCNPQALAQDLKVFAEHGFRAEYGQIVDMFPHTPHCEVLVRLIKQN